MGLAYPCRREGEWSPPRPPPARGRPPPRQRRLAPHPGPRPADPPRRRRGRRRRPGHRRGEDRRRGARAPGAARGLGARPGGGARGRELQKTGGPPVTDGGTSQPHLTAEVAGAAGLRCVVARSSFDVAASALGVLPPAVIETPEEALERAEATAR